MKKKHLLTTIFALVCAVIMILISSGTIYAQSGTDLSREILVYVQPSLWDFPASERGQLAPERINVRSNELKQAMKHLRIRNIARAIPDISETDTLRVLEDGKTIAVPRFSRIFRFQIGEESNVDSAIAVLSKIPGILFAEKNMDARLYLDDDYPLQWHLKNTGQLGGSVGEDIKAEEAWSIFAGSSNIRIGLIDSGVELNHDDLTGKSSGDSYTGTMSHGTHVAGIAAASHNNAGKVKGVDANAQVTSRRIFQTDRISPTNPDGYIGDAETASKIISAVDAGSHILNNSWGGGSYSTTVRMAFVYAYKLNRVAVVSMGNENSSITRYPAGFGQGIIAVGATNNIGSRWVRPDGTQGSNYGNHIDVAAPGNLIYSTIISNSYTYYTGTSMAAPVVSGIASLLKGYNSNLSNDDIENIIKLSTDDKGDPGWDQYYGTGRVNARKALNLLRAPCVLTQTSAVGGSDVGSTGYYTTVIYGAPGLPPAVYFVKRHEVQKNISYPANSWRAVWGRGVATNGWSFESPNFAMGWCAVVPGTVTSTSATLRTYVYEVISYAGNYLGYYPTSPSNVTFAYTALALPTTITTNSTLDGNFVFDNNITVNSGVTLTVTPGSVISFASGKSLTVNGILNANGTTSLPITFTSASGTTPGSWGSIIMDGSGTSGSNLNNIVMQYGTDIQFLNGANATLQNSTIQKNTRGVYVYNAQPQIMNNNIYENQQGGVYCISSGWAPMISDNIITKTSSNPLYKNYEGITFGNWAYGCVFHNDISGFYWGMYIGGGSRGYFTNENYDYQYINNRIRNCRYGLGVGWGALVDMFDDDGAGNSSIYNNDYYDLYVYQHSKIWDMNNYYGGGNPNQYVDETSYLYREGNPLTQDPWGGLAKVASTSNGINNQNEQTLSNQQTSGGNDIKEFLKGREYERQKDFVKAIEHYKQMIKSDKLAKMALAELSRIANQTENTDLKTYFELLKDTKTEYQAYVMAMLAGMYMRQGEREKSAALFDDIITKFPDTRDERNAWFQKFYYALHVQKDKEQAATLLEKIRAKYSQDDSEGEIDFAESILDPSKIILKNSDHQSKKDVIVKREIPKEFAVFQNYPNPFNPTTVISYQLPGVGTRYIVSLKVYDMLGREVAVLVDGMKDAGYYTATFNGAGLASGVYFTRFIANSQDGKSFVQVRKLLMTK